MLNSDNSITEYAARIMLKWMEPAAESQREYSAKCSILEIYSNCAKDLLASNDLSSRKDVEIYRSSPDPVSSECYHHLRCLDDFWNLRRKVCAEPVNRSTH